MNIKTTEKPNPFLQLIVILTVCFLIYVMCRSFYLSLNLCGREVVVQDLSNSIYDLIEKDFEQYKQQRDKVFEDLFIQKLTTDRCTSQLKPMYAVQTNDSSVCHVDATESVVALERKKFNDEIWHFLQKNPSSEQLGNLKHEPEFYLRNIETYWGFSLNPDYEKLIYLMSTWLNDSQKKELESKIEYQHGGGNEEYMSQMNLIVLVENKKEEVLGIEIEDTQPLSSFFTIWATERSCKADIVIHNSKIENVLFYSALSGARASGRQLNYRFSSEIDYFWINQIKDDNEADIAKWLIHESMNTVKLDVK